jgi:twinkle protein
MSLYQALGSKYACVAVKSAASALQDCTKEFEWLNAFDKIKLCLDNDKPGQEAAAQIAKLFDPIKVYWVKP